MTVLVTGASGFVGGYTSCALLGCGEDVLAVGGRRPVPAEAAGSTRSPAAADLTDASAIKSLLQCRPEAVIHAAALARLDECERNPDLAERTNTEAARLMLSSLPWEDRHEPLFIYISTDLVFDGKKAPPGGFTEDHPASPISVYGRTKHAAEQAVLEARNGVVVRLALAYGCTPAIHGGFLSWTRKSLERGEEVSLFVDEWRTPLHLADLSAVVRAIITIYRRSGRSLPQDFPRLFHAAGPQRINRYDLGLAAAHAFALPCSPLRAVSRSAGSFSAPRAEDVSMSCARIAAVLAVRPAAVGEGMMRCAAEDAPCLTGRTDKN